MKKQKYLFNDDIAIDEYHEKQASIFRHEFEEEPEEIIKTIACADYVT